MLWKGFLPIMPRIGRSLNTKYLREDIGKKTTNKFIGDVVENESREAHKANI